MRGVQTMDNVRCEKCGGEWSVISSIPESIRHEVARRFRENDVINGIRIFREATGLGLRDVKAVFQHIANRKGECHRCSEQLPDGDVVVCGCCRSLNYNW